MEEEIKQLEMLLKKLRRVNREVKNKKMFVASGYVGSEIRGLEKLLISKRKCIKD